MLFGRYLAAVGDLWSAGVAALVWTVSWLIDTHQVTYTACTCLTFCVKVLLLNAVIQTSLGKQQLVNQAWLYI